MATCCFPRFAASWLLVLLLFVLLPYGSVAGDNTAAEKLLAQELARKKAEKLFPDGSKPEEKKAAPKKRRKSKPRRVGDEGSSGQRCGICQAMVLEGRKVWKAAKTQKSGSPYHYLADFKKRGVPPEEIVTLALKKNVCNKPFLSKIPNPKGYALHIPTVQYECDNLLEKSGDDIVDALALGQDIAKLCWDLEVCGDRDEELFDFVEEDDDDKIDDDPDL